MDARIIPVIDALLASAEEMKQHAEWVQIVMQRFQSQWVPGEYAANIAIAQGIADHADLHYRRIETIERTWLERGDHSRLCGTYGPSRGGGCAGWCRHFEQAPAPVPPPTPRPAAAPAPVESKKEEQPRSDRFSLIELE